MTQHDDRTTTAAEAGLSRRGLFRAGAIGTAAAAASWGAAAPPPRVFNAGLELFLVIIIEYATHESEDVRNGRLRGSAHDGEPVARQVVENGEMG